MKELAISLKQSNMPVEIDITDEEIVYAEGVLLPSGKHFDGERRDFIRCLGTIDLQAVPGSGKTTALLAKLLILERHLPFADGSGILVISHTNSAINEIKNRIGKHCPRLFSYPNFVGTIQSFVDSFLAIPSFVRCMGYRPNKIDAEAYDLEIENYHGRMPQNAAKSWLDNKSDPVQVLKNLRFDPELNLIEGCGGKVILKSESPSKSYEILANMKNGMFKKGLLHFEDAFFFADILLSKCLSAKHLLRYRFGIVFVDEMQDMAKHQHDLLEKLFFEENPTNTVFQRIGDKNQSIFNGRNMAVDEVWRDRNKVLALNNSQRLSALNARILGPFALCRGEGFEVNGQHPANIKPYMFVYDDDTRLNVVERFAELVKKLYEQGRVELDAPKVFKAVSWNATWDDPPPSDGEKVRLIDYCPSFQRAHHKKAREFKTLADYLVCIDPKDQTLSSARKGILNGIVQVLRIEEVVDQRNERPFTAGSLLGYFRDNEPTMYNRFNLRIYQWSRALVGGQIKRPLGTLRVGIPRVLRYFGKSVSSSRDFINAPPSTEVSDSSVDRSATNILRFGDIEVELATVHSVKGQTHTATLYLESYYYSDGTGAAAKSYESQRLVEQFKGTALTSNVNNRVKESAKMVYVGFSRPTHLLCFAVHKVRFDQNLTDVDTSLWEIIKLFE